MKAGSCSERDVEQDETKAPSRGWDFPVTAHGMGQPQQMKSMRNMRTMQTDGMTGQKGEGGLKD